MFLNYLKIAIRNLLRQRTYSLVNILGLAIGMGACLVIVLFIRKELSFENMHPDADRIYRVLTIDSALGTHNQRVGITMPPLGPALPEAFPEVQDALRVVDGGRMLLRFEDQPAVYAEETAWADPNFFEYFHYGLLDGDPSQALAEPFSIILTETVARSIFGGGNAMGHMLKTGNGNDLKVTGIMQDLPDNTHLKFHALISISTLISITRQNQPPNATQPIWLENWGWVAMPTYIRLVSGTTPEGLDARFTQFSYDHGVEKNFAITLQPLSEVHLHSTDVIFDPAVRKGDIKNIYIFIAIAGLILIVAAVNYVNLSTARSTQRAREVGLRKVVGSLRSQLITQFISESVLLTFIALLISIALVQLALPWLNTFLEAKLTLNLLQDGVMIIFLLVLLIGVGLLAGLYPAFILSNFRPVTVLKGSFKSSRSGSSLRRLLVVFQFTLSVALIGLTAIIQKQMYFIHHKDLGYDREQVLILEMFDQDMRRKMNTFRNQLAEYSAFAAVATTGNIPGRTFGRTGVRPEGASDQDIWIWSNLAVSPETLPTLGMQMVDGRNFSRERPSDSSGVVIVNQTAVNQLGWENPLNRKLYFGEEDSVGVQIIGVVKDFHFIGLHQPIEPVVIFPLGKFPGNLIAARIEKGRISDALEYAGQKWQEIFPQHPFTFKFLDDEFNHLYIRDVNTSKIVNAFSLLSIFIACLGLISLASHSTTLRTKEIGIRKVLGASSSTIIKILVFDFIRWVLLASLLAWPLAWYTASRWLSSFVYRVKVDPMVFLVASGIAIIIAIMSVLSVSWRAAVSNPAKSLRYE